jgi:hypothetical protein
MRGWTFVLGLVALTTGFAGAEYGDRADWSPFVAPVLPMLVVLAYGLLRRGRDVVDVVGPASAIAYAGYVGFAVSRAFHPNMLAAQSHLLTNPLAAQLPMILFAGIPYALVAATFVAVPASKLSRWHKTASERDERFYAYIHERADAQRNARPAARSSDEVPSP